MGKTIDKIGEGGEIGTNLQGDGNFDPTFDIMQDPQILIDDRQPRLLGMGRHDADIQFDGIGAGAFQFDGVISPAIAVDAIEAGNNRDVDGLFRLFDQLQVFLRTQFRTVAL